jgi:hypothetical protein
MCLPRVRSAVMAPVRAVFDAGAGPNLVRDDLLPRGCESLLIPGQPLPLITNASGKRMPVKGVIVLYLQVGDLQTRVRFYGVRGLGVPCILGCTFIDIHVQSIHPKERGVELREGGPMAISTDMRLSGIRRQYVVNVFHLGRSVLPGEPLSRHAQKPT